MRVRLWWVALGLLAVSALGCSVPQPTVDSVLVNSQVALGPTRLGFGLINKDGSLLRDAAGKVRLQAETSKASLGDVDLKPVALYENATHTHGNGTPADPIATMYIANVNFTQTGWWSADISVKAGGKQYDHIKTRFFVDEKTTVPAIGAEAPKSAQTVLKDVKDASE